MSGLGHLKPAADEVLPGFATGQLTPPSRRSIRTRLPLLALIPLGVVLPLMMAALAS